MIEVVKKESESSASLIRRFTRKMQESGIVARAKSLRFHQRSISDLQKKKQAIKKVKHKKRLEYLRKLGKIE